MASFDEIGSIREAFIYRHLRNSIEASQLEWKRKRKKSKHANDEVMYWIWNEWQIASKNSYLLLFVGTWKLFRKRLSEIGRAREREKTEKWTTYTLHTYNSNIHQVLYVVKYTILIYLYKIRIGKSFIATVRRVLQKVYNVAPAIWHCFWIWIQQHFEYTSSHCSHYVFNTIWGDSPCYRSLIHWLIGFSRVHFAKQYVLLNEKFANIFALHSYSWINSKPVDWSAKLMNFDI